MTRERDRIQENANKYKVLNCPASYGLDNDLCIYVDGTRTGNTYCNTVPNCLIKQVIDLCNASIRPNETNIYRAGRMSLAVNIVGLFDIEEINK